MNDTVNFFHPQGPNAIRCLAIDAVQNANSGHPGMPMGMAAAAYVMWLRHLRHNPCNPKWADRDRFVLSAGHGSMLLYALLYLSGYDVSLEDLKRFRQWGSKTPGHPEYGHTPGVELTTGPLGQGLASAVGFAIAERHLAARFNRGSFSPVDHRTWVIAGDGCLQEGVTSEACSLAGHLGLGKLNVVYDDNQITIDGSTDLSFTEDVSKRFQAYGWQVIEVDGDGTNLEAIDAAYSQASANSDQPSLIKIRSIIGYGSPNQQGSHSIHGSPLGADEIERTKGKLGWPSLEPFHVPKDLLAHFREIAKQAGDLERVWIEAFARYESAHPDLAKTFMDWTSPNSHRSVAEYLPTFAAGDRVATRSASGAVLNAVMPNFDFILGGSADLSPSNNTRFDGAFDFQSSNHSGRYIRYGVREHAMGAILNGINVHGQLRAYGGTFMVFADYMRPAIRLAALSGYPTIFVLTHDSIGVGEDGPTHQPVETLASLRAILGLRVFRPADANETAQAWRYILENDDAPAALLLSRQGLLVIDEQESYKATHRGAYSVNEVEHPDVLLLASGSEVELALLASNELTQRNIQARVVSMPCWELFEKQDDDYQEAVLPGNVVARVGIEAGIDQGWYKYIGQSGKFVGLSQYGASAPGHTCYEEFGLTVSSIVSASLQVIQETAG